MYANPTSDLAPDVVVHTCDLCESTLTATKAEAAKAKWDLRSWPAQGLSLTVCDACVKWWETLRGLRIPEFPALEDERKAA